MHRNREGKKRTVSIRECHIIELPKIADPRGNLSVIEGGRHIPFEIKRVFYLYDVPGGETRAGHALKNTEQFIIAASGSFDVVLDDGSERRTYGLNRSWKGVYVSPMVWRELVNFSSAGVCLVLASDHYDEDEYYRDYQEFLRAAAARSR
jgi:WxcM-like, C-terminal